MANDKLTANVKTTVPNSDFLIRGSDYLAGHPDFKLIGREEDLKEVSIALMRRDNNNIIMYGPNGVGTSAVVMGLQASKDLPNTPFDIVGKRFFWLDTDGLFASGDNAKINEGFQKALETLSRAPDTVLVIDDVKDFVDGCRNSGTMNLVNGLMREVRGKRFQVIMEARDENLADLFKMHSDLGQLFTMKEVEPPADKATLRNMLNESVKSLEEHHGVHISEDAINQVVDLTWKYPGLTLGAAQPKRSLIILEGAMTGFRYKAHTRPLELDGLEEDLAVLTEMVVNGKSKSAKAAAYADKAPQELEGLKLETENRIREVTEAFSERQKLIREGYSTIRNGETSIRELEDDIAAKKEKEDTARKLIEEYREANGDAKKEQDAKDQYFNKYGEKLTIPNNFEASTRVSDHMRRHGMYSEEVRELEDKKVKFEGFIKEDKAKFAQLTRGSEQLVLDGDQVLTEFSKLSRIPMNKLQQDETEKMLNLETTLGNRVFGQPEPVKALADAVRTGRTGLKKPNVPIGNFIFLGPSGVGKTELAKALAAALFGDESALEIYNMSEYMEKHAVSSLIGAPPGYDGYDAGGLLTNNMRRKPYCVNVFDEAEKAHREVFDIFLQVFDEGKLKDRRGVEASFSNAINILTSNIGAQYFLDDTLTFEEAKEKALKDLRDTSPDDQGRPKGFRIEFLNRADGIFCFNRLGQPEILMIANKNIKEINGWLAEKGIKVSMPEEDKAAMCKDKYVPREGGRGIMRYIKTNITSEIAKTLMRHPNQPGAVTVAYDKEQQATVSTFTPEAKVQLPVNENSGVAVATPASTAGKAANVAFKPK